MFTIRKLLLQIIINHMHNENPNCKHRKHKLARRTKCSEQYLITEYVYVPSVKPLATTVLPVVVFKPVPVHAYVPVEPVDCARVR